MKKVFVNGTFDVLHLGHLSLLSYAADCGDYLLVALDSDSRVSNAKGPTRPFNNLNTRKTIMSTLRMVDQVACFSSDEELESIISEYSPDIMIVGSDWADKPIVGSKYAKSLLFFDRIPEFSTTSSLDNYANSIRETV